MRSSGNCQCSNLKKRSQLRLTVTRPSDNLKRLYRADTGVLVVNEFREQTLGFLATVYDGPRVCAAKRPWGLSNSSFAGCVCASRRRSGYWVKDSGAFQELRIGRTKCRCN
jgi:hypothetical protein